MTNILAVIPARGGSKGIQGKNVRLLDGKPLVAHQIETALGTKSVDKVIVSTDHDEIAEAARNAGATVPFSRPSEFASDDIPVIAAIKHAAEYWQEQHQTPDYTLCLQPTSPFTSPDTVEAAIEKIQSTDCDSVVSVERVTETHPYRAYQLADDKVRPIDGLTITAPDQRQDRPNVYGFTGAIYLRQTELLFEWEYDDFALGDDVRAVIQSGIETIDIDTEFQLRVARAFVDYDEPKHEFPEEIELPETIDEE